MHHLGLTRSVATSTHLLQTPDTFVRIRLPGMDRAAAIVHASPANGARFTQYTAEIESGGSIDAAVSTVRAAQRFVYVLNGTVTVTIPDAEHRLEKDGFAYLPPACEHRLVANSESRVEIFEKPYIALQNELPPVPLTGHEPGIASQPLMGDAALQVRSLLPDSFAFDFAVNTMEYQPGSSLSMVEMHVMEHGLLMLQGGGIYRLNDCWYAVSAGDFIWMAPYCPQWFGALGKQPAKYLIYKDWNRNPLD